MMLIHMGILTISAILVSSLASTLEQEGIFDIGDNNRYENAQIQGARVCRAKECRKLAQMYTEAMDKNVDPCVNFYEHTCGRWAAEYPMPHYVTKWNRFQLSLLNIEKYRKDILKKTPRANDILPIQQAKMFYQSCMNTDARKTRGIKTIATILESNGGWPMAINVEDWKSHEHLWQDIDENFMHLGVDYAFYEIGPYLRKPGDLEGQIFLLESPSNHYLPKFRENYDDFESMLVPIVEEFIRYNRANVSTEKLREDILDLYKFQRKLLNAKWLSNKHKMYNMSLDALNLEFSSLSVDWDADIEPSDPMTQVDWKRVIQQLFNVEEIEIDGDSQVQVEKMYYNVLPDIWAVTDKRTIVNYIHWKFVSQTLKYTTSDMRNKLSMTEANSQYIPRWRQCLRETKMAHADVYKYVKKYFRKDIQETVRKIAENVRGELNHQIVNSNWLSNDAKAAVEEKLRRIDILIGFPDWYKNRTAIEYHYKGLTIGDDYVTNMLSFWRHKKKYTIRLSIGREQLEGWAMSPFDAGAGYFPDWNSINVPAGAFQRPFLGPKLPDYVNYANLGTMIGHEIGHVFDTRRIDTSADGVHGILDSQTMNNYRDQHFCIEKQSMDYYKNEARVSLTLDENIADTIGMHSSLGAYKRLRQKEGFNEDLKLPGFEDYTDEQMFFISYGRGWCEIIAPGYRKSPSNSHSPPVFRVNGAVSNTPEFGKAFNCPLGSPMNPPIKCNIWTKNVSK